MSNDDDGLEELSRKVEGSLSTTIRRHVDDHALQHGITAWNAKNSVMLSYLIELIFQRRCGKAGIPMSSQNRLLELRTILEKMRSLDKKLRYQIDKLLAVNEENFATAVADDPLLYRPAVQDDDDDSSDDNEEEIDDDAVDEEGADDDDDLATARQTVALAMTHQAPPRQTEQEKTVYRAPRHAAVPYTLDKQDRERTRELQRRRKLRDSEVAEAIRHQYSETPETEDATGGTAMGRQRAASRKLMEEQQQRDKFEEDNMMRLTVTRAEKKSRKRMMREEMSNLSAIADLGNIAKESRVDRKRKNASTLPAIDEEDAPKKREYEARPRNALQADIFGGEHTKKKKKKGKR